MNEKTVTLGGREYTAEELRAELEKIEKGVPKIGSYYWFIDRFGDLKKERWEYVSFDRHWLKTGNHWTNKPSQEEVDMWNLRNESIQYIDINKSFAIINDDCMNRYYEQRIGCSSFELSKYTILDFIPKKYQKAWEYEYTNVKPK